MCNFVSTGAGEGLPLNGGCKVHGHSMESLPRATGQQTQVKGSRQLINVDNEKVDRVENYNPNPINPIYYSGDNLVIFIKHKVH